MERRKFITSLAITGLGLSGCRLLNAKADKPSLGLQLFSVRDAVAKNLEGTLEKLVKIGYRKLEIYGYDGTFWGRKPSEFKNILSNVGMEVISSHHTTGWVHRQKGTLTDGWQKAVEDLHYINARYMACSYLFPEERTAENYKALPDLLNRSGEQTLKANIGFAYHNHDFEFEKYQDTLVFDHILHQTSSNLVNIELDLYWIVKAGHDPVSYFHKYPGRFPLWHVKDMEAGTGAITEVGNGTIDFDRIFAARQIAGMKTWFVEQDTSNKDMFDSLKISYEYIFSKKYR